MMFTARGASRVGGCVCVCMCVCRRGMQQAARLARFAARRGALNSPRRFIGRIQRVCVRACVRMFVGLRRARGLAGVKLLIYQRAFAGRIEYRLGG